MSNNIVVVGSCMIDFISYAAQLPKAGETVLGTIFQTGFGGKGANQCVAAAKLGGNTSLIARLGDDSWGENYLKSLNNLNVDTNYVKITPEHNSGIAQITVDESGQNQIVVVGGANGKLCPNDVQDAYSIISKASVVICQLETSSDAALKAIELCKGTSILNGAPAIANCDSRLLSSPTIFCVNETEAAVFTGLPVNNVEDAKKAIKDLINRGCNTVILTLGSEGALLTSRINSEIIHIKSAKVTTVDTTGAGDAFLGALAYLIADFPKFDLKKCIEIACAMAANSVTKPGTQISFSDDLFLNEYLAKNNLV